MSAKPDETQILLGSGEKKQAPPAFRWLILLTSCLLAFGGYFVYDMVWVCYSDLFCYSMAVLMLGNKH